MTSLIRPLLSSILCCVIALGHAPAWLHVGTCDGECHVSAVTAAQKTKTVQKARIVCSRGCHHHSAVDGSSQSGEPVQRELSTPGHSHIPSHDHDSDRCVICQSLACASGVISLGCIVLAAEYACEPVLICADRMPVEAAIAIAHPRGPPSVA